MGFFKKLILGFFLLIVLGIVAAFGMQYYYETFYDKVPVEVKSDTVTGGDVFYLSHTLEPGTYKIEAGGGTGGSLRASRYSIQTLTR